MSGALSLGAPLPYRGDSILVHDDRLGRITVYDDQGRLGRTSTAPELAFMDPVGGLAGGSIVARRWAVYRSSRDQTGTETGTDRREVAFLVLTPDGEVDDTLGRFTGNETFYYRGERVATLWPIPFGRRLKYDAGGGRIAIASTDVPQITVYSTRADSTTPEDASKPEKILRLAHTPVPVEQEWIDTIRSRQEAQLRSGSRITLAVLDELWQTLPRHETLPAFEDVRVDREGRIWIERVRPPGDDEPVHDVFDPDGRYLGYVGTPTGLEITDLAERWILGVRTDELGVERVEMYLLSPATPPV